MQTLPKKKSVSILDVIKTNYPQVKEYKQSDKEQSVVESVFYKFRHTSDDRNRNFAYFDGLNLVDYINDSVIRFTTNIDERDGLEDWQARVNNPMTRNKVIATLGKVISTLPIAEFKSRGDEDIRKGLVLTTMYEYIEDQEEYNEVMTHLLLEAIVKGTAVGYEGVIRDKYKCREVEGVGDDIKVSEYTNEETKFPTTIVPLEDFYPSSVSIRTIKEMPYCFWRSVIPYSQFCQDYKMYSKYEYVVPKFSLVSDATTEFLPFYWDKISQDVTEGNVEIIRYYDKENDEFVITANGIWLNPINTKESEEISPMPFNHKELPFFDIKFDIFGDWFYGKSMPDKLKSMQDVLNVLTNMLLDQSFLTIFPPILTNGSDSIEDDYLRPGRRTPIDTQGQSLNESFMKLDLGTPSGWHQYILDYTQKIMEQSSLDQIASGQAGVGGRTTAQEVNTAANALAQTLGVFGNFVNYGIKRKAALKGANILQFSTDTKNPLIVKMLGKEGAENAMKYFNVIKMEDTYLSDGRRGTKVIEMYEDKKDMPNKATLQARSALTEVDTGKPHEIVAFPPEYIRNFQFDVKIVPNPKSEQTKELRKALQLEKVKTYVSFFPEIIDMNELAAQTAEVMGDDPSKIIKAEILNPAPPSDNPNAESPMPMNPTGGVGKNMVKGSAGGSAASDQMNIMLKGSI